MKDEPGWKRTELLLAALTWDDGDPAAALVRAGVVPPSALRRGLAEAIPHEPGQLNAAMQQVLVEAGIVPARDHRPDPFDLQSVGMITKVIDRLREGEQDATNRMVNSPRNARRNSWTRSPSFHCVGS